MDGVSVSAAFRAARRSHSLQQAAAMSAFSFVTCPKIDEEIMADRGVSMRGPKYLLTNAYRQQWPR